VAETFDELVAMQRAADQAYNRVQELRDRHGPPTHTKWTPAQTRTYETALWAWWDLIRNVRAAVTQYAKAEGKERNEVEVALSRAVGHPSPEDNPHA
jgi:hypothetical protein